ncbi:MAG: hypothetical protein V4498_01975 [candidate division FCPU426 bacterium]
MKAPRWSKDELRLAVIDLGTNAIRFDAYILDPKGAAHRLHREKRMIRLGDGLFNRGRLEAAPLARLNTALGDFSRMIKAWDLKNVAAFATSALRDAPGAAKLVRSLNERFGIGLKVISGAHEARLTAEGILANEKLPRGLFALLDIGGGSVELSYCRGKKVLKSLSLDLGCLRLRERFLSGQPPLPGELTDLRQHLRQSLKKLPPAPLILGSSGTVRALSKIARTHHHPMDLPFLYRLNTQMALLHRPGLLALPGMETKRVDIILAGSVILEEFVIQLKAKTVQPTEFSLRDGLFLEALERLKSRRKKG